MDALTPNGRQTLGALTGAVAGYRLRFAPYGLPPQERGHAPPIEKVFRAPYAAPNGLQVTDEGLWIVDQFTDRVALVETGEPHDYGATRIIRHLPTESSTTSGITYGGGALWLAANGPGERWRTPRPTDAVSGRDSEGGPGHWRDAGPLSAAGRRRDPRHRVRPLRGRQALADDDSQRHDQPGLRRRLVGSPVVPDHAGRRHSRHRPGRRRDVGRAPHDAPHFQARLRHRRGARRDPDTRRDAGAARPVDLRRRPALLRRDDGLGRQDHAG